MGLKIDLRCSCKVEAAAQTFDGSFRQLRFSPSSHISTSFTVGDLPTQWRHSSPTGQVAELPTHTTQAALLPQIYPLITGDDQARPAERERAVKGAPYLWEKKKINLRKLVNDT